MSGGGASAASPEVGRGGDALALISLLHPPSLCAWLRKPSPGEEKGGCAYNHPLCLPPLSLSGLPRTPVRPSVLPSSRLRASLARRREKKRKGEKGGGVYRVEWRTRERERERERAKKLRPFAQVPPSLSLPRPSLRKENIQSSIHPRSSFPSLGGRAAKTWWCVEREEREKRRPPTSTIPFCRPSPPLVSPSHPGRRQPRRWPLQGQQVSSLSLSPIASGGGGGSRGSEGAAVGGRVSLRGRVPLAACVRGRGGEEAPADRWSSSGPRRTSAAIKKKKEGETGEAAVGVKVCFQNKTAGSGEG